MSYHRLTGETHEVTNANTNDHDQIRDRNSSSIENDHVTIGQSKSLPIFKDLRELNLLIWKNWLLQKRSIISTLIELIVPAVFAIILLPLRHIIKSEQHLNDTVYSAFNFNEIPFFPSPMNEDEFFTSPTYAWSFAYQPNNSQLLDSLMKQVGEYLQMNILGFANESLMENYAIDPMNFKTTLGCVSFLSEDVNNFVYKLRFSSSPRNSAQTGLFKRDMDWKTRFIYWLFPILGPREKGSNEGGDPGYYREGFLAVQKAIDIALISQFNSDVSSVDIQLKRFPYPPYDDDKFVAVVSALFPFIIQLSFIFTIILTAKSIVHEKETGIKEAMRLMGMKSWIYWLSWYIKTFLMLTPSVLFMIMSYKIKITLVAGNQASIIDKTDPFLFGAFLFLYVSSSITFTFMCTAFFKKANSAAAGTGIIWFFSYLPYIFISLRYSKMTLFDKILALFVNNLAMAEGIQLIGMFEGKGTGIQWSNFAHGVSVDDNFSLLLVMVFMYLLNFVHLSLLYYFEKIMPGDHGIAKPWYFPIYCLIEKRKVKPGISQIRRTAHLQEEATDADDSAPINITGEQQVPVFLEDESIYSRRRVGIKVKNISKSFTQFGVEKSAVRNLSVNIYEGQITVLLGHNGAGKSTSISMMTGLIKPSNGNIYINGIDIVEETKRARKCIGLCPQHNLLFDALTVYEHLQFFSKMKESYNEEEITAMLDIINLSDKRDALASTLSGGMKRKLSIAIAFIGNSSIVILDEPTSGMDPQARHSTWSLLQKFKNERNCTILLTTHFMDEADVLGDRIAIMSHGKLKCCGSPLFLKSKYGSGYNITLTKKRRSEEASSSSAENASSSQITDHSEDNTNKLINLIYNLIPNAKLNSNINSEISFILPTSETNRFAYLFERLDKEKDNLGILNIGISITTLEDVFLKIEENENFDETFDSTKKNSFTQSSQHNNLAYAIPSQSALNNSMLSNNIDHIQDDEFLNFGLWTGSKNEDRLSGVFLVLQQFHALFIKRFIHTIRNKALIISQLVIPIATLLINLIYLKYAPIQPEDSPALTINISRYSTNYVPFVLNKLVIDVDADVSSKSTNQKLIEALSESFKATINERHSNTKAFPLNSTEIVKICEKSRSSIDELISCAGRLNFQYVIDSFVLGADFNLISRDPNTSSIQLVSHFNNQPFHVPPMALNFLTTSLFNVFTNSTGRSITVINHPLPRNLQDEVVDLELKDMTGFNVASGLTFGFSFLIASFAVFLIKENSSSSKHLQYLSGCSSYIFWISAFIWDMVNYLFTLVFVILLLKLFGITEFVGDTRWVAVLSLLILYGLAHIPQIYLLSYMFSVSATGFAFLVGWNILTSQVTMTPTQILSLPQLQLVDVSNILEWVFLVIFPNFCIGQSLIDLYENYQITNICKNFTSLCPFVPNPCCYNFNSTNPNKCGVGTDCLRWTENFLAWEKPGLLRFFIFMPIQFLIQFAIILIYEAGYFRILKYKFASLVKRNQLVSITDTQIQLEQEHGDIRKDADVLNEENRIENLVRNNEFQNNHNEIFIVNKLTKYYSNFMAVKGISFSLASTETFGLLGVNGAGKTTTFKMITGNEFFNNGDAYLNSTSLKKNIKKFQKQLGYCPQFDPLIDQMTVLETMQMFGRLRGIKPSLLKKTCISLIHLLTLEEHANKMCYTLSGGNKRKLSVAISLIGSPLVILLDEPTSGMDPKTRRTLWNCLNTIRNKGKSLILTTHSMDETEALCTSIGIMVNGELKCLGSLQNLKSKYGEGYTLLVKLGLISAQNDMNSLIDTEKKNKKIEEFVNFIFSKFKNSTLKENRDGFLNIHINENSTHILSNIFSLIENVKLLYSIEYYVVTQTKLEQIFLNFASKQVDPESRFFQKSTFSVWCC